MAKDWQQLLFASFVIIIIFTIADYYSHKYLEDKYDLDVVGEQYYFNKILYGTPWIFFALLSIDKIITLSYYHRIYVISSIVVWSLQFRYLYQYNSKFNFTILVLHYILLTPIIYFAEKRGYV